MSIQIEEIARRTILGRENLGRSENYQYCFRAKIDGDSYICLVETTGNVMIVDGNFHYANGRLSKARLERIHLALEKDEQQPVRKDGIEKAIRNKFSTDLTQNF